MALRILVGYQNVVGWWLVLICMRTSPTHYYLERKKDKKKNSSVYVTGLNMRPFTLYCLWLPVMQYYYLESNGQAAYMETHPQYFVVSCTLYSRGAYSQSRPHRKLIGCHNFDQAGTKFRSSWALNFDQARTNSDMTHVLGLSAKVRRKNNYGKL